MSIELDGLEVEGVDFDFSKAPDIVEEKGEPTIEKQEEKEEQGDLFEPNDDFLSVQFNLLKENGLLKVPDDFKFDGSIEKYQEAHELHQQLIRQEIESSLFGNASEDLKLVVDYLNAGGTDLKGLLSQLNQTVDTTTEQGKITALKEKYKSSGLSDRQVNTIVQSIIDDGELDKEIKRLNAQAEEQNKLLLEQNKKKIEEEKLAEQASLKKYAEDMVSFMQEQKWESSKTKKLQEFVFNGKLADSLNEILTDPKATVILSDFLTYYNSKDKTFDLINYKAVETKLANKVNNNWKEKLSSFTGNKLYTPEGAIDISSIDVTP